jgi:cation transport regulator ChaB
MTGPAQDNAMFIRSLPMNLPPAAQHVYVDAYKQSMAKPVEGLPDAQSRESVADRDAWDAVRREFIEDPLTHKWSHVGDHAPAEETRSPERSVLARIRGLLKH